MKKRLIFLLIVLFPLFGFSYTWISFCPDSIHANNIIFGVGDWQGVICSPDGMYLFEEDIQEWAFYTYGGLPVKGVAYFSSDKILVAMGEGTYSDGVYTFDLETHQFEVVEWIINPNFLVHYLPTNTYFIGCQFGGMYESSDGLTWTGVSYFSGKSCSAMEFYDNHLVVTEVSNIYNIFWSDDYGVNWQESTGSIPMITELKFSLEGDLYGIFPSYSNSSGLYSSNDFGQTWDVEFWSDNMSAVGFDAMGTVFVGWESPTANNEGIAIYTPGVPSPNLTYLNEGLPNLNINKILLNPAMSAIAIFCCTDAGVYLSYDYMVGEEENEYQPDQIKIFPNPVSAEKMIRIENSGDFALEHLDVYSNAGRFVFGKELSNFDKEAGIVVDLHELQSGIYIIRIRTSNSEFTEKLVIY